MAKELPKSVVIIGAGPSGVFAARRLQQIAKEKGKEISIVILEKEAQVGGKCSSYSDPDNPELVTERGAALVAPNYGVVIDAINENQLDYELVLESQEDSVEFAQFFKQLSGFQKLSNGLQLVKEYIQFINDHQSYLNAKKHNTCLPENLKKPFLDYAQEKGMTLLPLFARAFVPAFGYGDNRDIATFYVLEYFGRFTILDILLAKALLGKQPLLSIKGGYQGLIEAIAKDFDVKTSVQVEKITRDKDTVNVEYQTEKGEQKTITADMLILATSPLQWPKMGLDATKNEQSCIDNLSYYRYPVAVCKIKGLAPNHVFFPKALDKEYFGHLALITTRDNRPNPEDGRLCTIYVNLPPGPNTYQMDRTELTKELLAVQGVTDVEFLEEKTWEDYMSAVPWEIRQQLYEEQLKGNTLHLNSCMSFEDVASVANAATDTLNEYLGLDLSLVEMEYRHNWERANTFFYRKHLLPVDQVSVKKAAPSSSGLVELSPNDYDEPCSILSSQKLYEPMEPEAEPLQSRLR
ncbi:FAD-dependent oxidoreductase [Legionella sp. W05-934-2]|uniref:FAD-dependent oxidoreductase n=1 Tax=Legionella sp. W05-934-2 TaxID=1198649 RepID=UPI00346370A3